MTVDSVLTGKTDAERHEDGLMTTLVFVDSRSAARAIGGDAEGILVVTDNPLVAHAEACRDFVTDISPELDQATAKKLGEAAIDLLLELDREVYERGIAERYAGVSRRLNLTIALRATLSTLLHRGFMAARAVEKYDAVSVVICGVETDRWIASHPFLLERYASPHRSLAQHGFFGQSEVSFQPVQHDVPTAFNDTSTDSFATRVASAPLTHSMFHILKETGITRLFPGVAIACGKRCEMLDETMPWLAMRGCRILSSQPPGLATRIAEPFNGRLVADSLLEDELLAWLIERIASLGVFSQVQSSAIARVVFDHLAAGLSVLRKTRAHLEDWSGKLKAKGVKAYLTSGIYGPHGVLVYEALKSQGIPLIDFEHGVTTGIAHTSDRRLDVSEATTSDVLLACSERSAGRFSNACARTARRVEAVGNADQVRKLFRQNMLGSLARRRLGINHGERVIMHVSTLLYGGNMRAGDDAPAEASVYKFDKALLEDVYPQIRGTVLFKPYPTDRFADQARYDETFDLAPNTRLLGFEDFRYIRAAADMIVTQANSSTIGWCIACDVPLVHLHSRQMNSLAGEDLISQFSEAFFLVDVDQEDWQRQLVEILNRPAVERDSAWAAKGAARAALFQEALAGPAGATGKRAAEVVAETVYRQ